MDEWGPCKRLHYKSRLEYLEESWRLEGMCSHSDPRGKPSANTGVKISNNNINKDKNNNEYFKQQTGEFLCENSWTWPRKRTHPTRETESLLIAAENNTIRTNYVMAKIDNTSHNNLCNGDIEETVDHISEYCRLLYKTRQDEIRKVIHRGLWKKLECGHIT